MSEELPSPTSSFTSWTSVIVESSTATSTASTRDTDSPVALTLYTNPDRDNVLISVVPPSAPTHAEKRARVNICCIIDISGSMGEEALIPADPKTGAAAESTGLCVLDIVKHSLRTMMTTMRAGDRIALVTFNHSAQVIAPLTNMTDTGKRNLLEKIERLKPGGSTNLWDGLKTGMKLLHASAESSSIGTMSTVFLLTDGIPNIVPPRGHMPMLKEYLAKHDDTQPFSISTFGFGYVLDSPLLLEIARISGGTYGFIPDPGMVGTVFIHAMANVYATYAPRAKLVVEAPGGIEVLVKGNFPSIRTSWGAQIEIGDVQFGQSRDIVLTFNKPPKDLFATLTYKPFLSSKDLNTHATLSHGAVSNPAAVKYHGLRLRFVDLALSLKLSELEASAELLKILADELTTSAVLKDHTNALALLKDISGQALLAVQPAYFSRWGRHYLPSLAHAHQRQQCGNFRDPGLQIYGRDSQVFIEERDKLDAAFDELPPPTPSISPTSVDPPMSPSGSQRPAQINITHHQAPSKATYIRANRFGSSGNFMFSYRNSSVPCFGGECLVTMANGSQLRVEQLKRGMAVKTLKGTGEVAAVLRTSIHSGETLLCHIGNLLITPWHPVLRPSGQWMFPAQFATPLPTPCKAVYSVLLSPGQLHDPDMHSVSIADVWCTTLGHGLTAAGDKEDVRAHPFFGDYEKVLNALSALEGFVEEDGVVHCIGTKRDVTRSLVFGFVREGREREGCGVAIQLQRPALSNACT